MSAVSQPDWLQHGISLKPFNTLGVPATARYFTEVTSLKRLREVLQWAQTESLEILPLGGGSNIILANDYQGLVIKLAIKGRQILEPIRGEQSEEKLVEVGAGENWHEFVQWTVAQGCFGLENLSLIPGSVGAAPIQNVGAYGVEIKDLFHSLVAMNVETGELLIYSGEQCQFGYRDSVFKGVARDRFIIVAVTFALNHSFVPRLDYGHLQKEVLAAAGEQPVTAHLVSEVVCRIRSEKLPDPVVLGNAGSFFKNPLVDDAHYRRLLAQEPGLVAFSVQQHWKLAAGWLIERCGFKGVQRESGAGVYPHQALVLVNNGAAAGADVLTLATEIQQAVQQRFAVELEIEPRVYS